MTKGFTRKVNFYWLGETMAPLSQWRLFNGDVQKRKGRQILRYHIYSKLTMKILGTDILDQFALLCTIFALSKKCL